MSLVENGISFIRTVVHAKEGAKTGTVEPTQPAVHPEVPKKYKPVLERAFANPKKPDVSLLCQQSNHEIWESPGTVSAIFATFNKGDIKPHDLEETLRLYGLIHKIYGKALRDPTTMATVIETTVFVDTYINMMLTTHNGEYSFNPKTCRYNTTADAIERLNGLSQNPSFHEFLNQKVGFDTVPAFEKVRNLPHNNHY